MFGNDDDDEETEADVQHIRKESKLTNAPGPVKNGKNGAVGTGRTSSEFPVSNGKQHVTMSQQNSMTPTSSTTPYSNSKIELNDEEKQELIVCLHISYFFLPLIIKLLYSDSTKTIYYKNINTDFLTSVFAIAFYGVT